MAEALSRPAEHDPRQPLFVVALGAAAGGVTAVEELFAAVPPGSGAAFILTLHLPSDHLCRLEDLLRTGSPMPVTRVSGRVPIEPDRAYLVPSHVSVGVADGHLIANSGRPRERRAPVDLLFRVLAESYGPRTACVVLSGEGAGGSAGLKRVKEHGGLVIAQDPDEAQCGEMPRRAIATGFVDLVLPAAQIQRRIAEWQARTAGDGDDRAGAELGDEAVREVLTLLRLRGGHDLSSWEPVMLRRRLERRMLVRGVPSLASYASLVREQLDEPAALMREILTSVSSFFRDPEAFEAVAARAIAPILQQRTSQDQVRVWVPGCATGEEAYSIAMLFAEHGALSPQAPRVQIFATDLDERAIATAREGIYGEAEVVDVSERRLQRFFHPGAHSYRVRGELREMLLFAVHDLTRDPPFSHFDLVSCRNLLVHLNRSIQDRVLDTFHFALRPGGTLVLGPSDPAVPGDRFAVVDSRAHVYEARAATSRAAVQAPDGSQAADARGSDPPRIGDRIAPSELHHRLLEQYAPPSVVVTEEHGIVHLSDRAGRYLRIAGGEPTRDLLRLARPDLRRDLGAALRQAAQQRSTVEVRGVRAALEDGDSLVDIEVRPVLRESDPARGYFLVIFREGGAPDEAGARRVSSPMEPAVRQLEDELVRVKAQLHATIAHYETQIEQAREAHEELVVVNDELRSSAEELQATAEELQSVSEELAAVDTELKIALDDLTVTRDHCRNLVGAGELAAIVLDRHRRLRLSTPAAREMFGLAGPDEDRPLAEITRHLLYTRLDEDVRDVLEHLQPLDREVEARDGRWHLTRIRPYRTADDRIDGVVVTFHEVTGRLHAERRVHESEERLRRLVDSAVDYAIFTITPAGRIDSWNTGAHRMFGYTAEEILGQAVEILFTPEDRAEGVPAAELVRAAREGRASDERFHMRQDGSRFYSSGVTSRLGPDARLGFVKIARDLSAQLQAMTELNDATSLLRKLVRSQEDERARIARDLHDQLGQQLTALRLALERHRQNLEAGCSWEHLDRALALATSVDEELDFLAWELRPAVLDDLGLAAALPRYVRDWSEHYGIAADVRSAGFRSGMLSREAEVAFYRIAQEALNNVTKHAHASRVDVLLESRDGSVVMVIEDDGVGFDPSLGDIRARGIGLAGMRERAALIGAQLQIESTPGQGASIFLRSGPAPVAEPPV